ncbi:MAG: pyridoxal kinase PdxY [Hyphomicrobiales bacterium]|nr:pyridoxal kinase PdxY [Hyphomicrobiales bacterium]
MNILSIQSHVAFGHVGNSAAVFPLQRLGHEVWPVHTVQFSNHTGYGAWKGRAFEAALIDDCVEGVFERGVLGQCDGVLSGYVGAPETGAAIIRAVKRVKSANPQALYCCDPVIGDVGRGVFVRPGVPEFFVQTALGVADIVTPNQFELEWLTGAPVVSLQGLRTAVAALRARGPKVVLVTSAQLADTPFEALDMFVSADDGLYRLRTPRLDMSVNGGGDAIAALFFAHYLTTRSAREALENAAASIFGLLARTLEANSREILLVDAQEEIVAPTNWFPAEKV